MRAKGGNGQGSGVDGHHEGQFPSHEAPPTSNSHPIHFAPSPRVGSFTQPLIFLVPDNHAAALTHDTCSHQIIQQ